MADFVVFCSLLALLITRRVTLLWKGKIAFSSDANLNENTSFFRVLRRYQASIPSIAIMTWLLIPAALASHYSESIEKGIGKNLAEIA